MNLKNYRLALFITIVYSSLSAQDVNVWTTLNMEDTVGVSIGTTTMDSLWQIGKPQKTYFDSSHSRLRAVVTDTLNFYPKSTTSAFTIKTTVGLLQGYGFVDLSFYHKYDTDTLTDGGTILVSSDNQNWSSISNFDGLYLQNSKDWWNSKGTVQSLGEKGFSGKSNGWQNCYLPFYEGISDSLYFKFVFTSDSIETNKEGWMIDDITFWINLGVNAKKLETINIDIYPNPASQLLNIRCENFKEFQLSTLTGKILISGREKLVHLHSVPSGMYLLSVHTDFGIWSKVIVVAD